MPLRFGDFVLDQESRQLSRGSERVALEPRAWALLTLLLSKHPRALSKEQIRDVLWPGTFVSESALARIVADVRSALGDDARNPRYIRTLHGFGYAFCGSVAIEEPGTAQATPGDSSRSPGGEEDAEGSPYPGLASFTEGDAARFFGREAEVTAVLERLKQKHLIALVGPSGAGKTSFLRAGVVPGRPAEWGVLVFSPGPAPMRSFARALAPELATDKKALADLVDFGEPDVALSLLRRWRSRHAEALVIVDPFEELFTLCGREIQERFAALLGRIANEGGLRVLLSLRDDFLMRCHEHEPLRPVFNLLTPLLPPETTELGRALEEPARARGYRFEDEALPDEMIEEATVGARAPLPLLAFTVARLWELRDRRERTLTRRAYDEIGGVVGSLAQHAEASLERIGAPNEPVVRELFRNLMTAQGTRTSRQLDELLSVHENRDAVQAVISELIDARLLTSYELSAGDGPRAGCHQIEIAHESLVSAWPRLVRWRTQDADGAQLRDQIRQAARIWWDRGQPDDLLWSGSSFDEYALWRKRCPGKLSAPEDAFAAAMEDRATRRWRRRRVAVAGAFAALVAVVAATGTLWRQSEVARQEAQDQALGAEAARLLALGQLQLDAYPSAAVAYALASLERADTLEARRFVVEALWRGPTCISAQIADIPYLGEPTFSPDGERLSLGGAGKVAILARDGGSVELVDGHANIGFSPDSDVLLVEGEREGRTIEFRSMSEARVTRTVQLGEPTLALLRGATLFTLTGRSDRLVRSWPLAGGEPRVLGRVENWRRGDIDRAGQWLAQATGPVVRLLPMDALGVARARIVGRQAKEMEGVRFFPAGDRVASIDQSGSIAIWSLDAPSSRPTRVLATDERAGGLPAFRDISISPSGAKVAALSRVAVHLWDLDAPPEAEPLALRRGNRFMPAGAAFDPTGRWIATTTAFQDLSLWPLSRQYARVLRGHTENVVGLAFAPDGERLFSSSWDGTVREWPLAAARSERSRVVFQGSPMWPLDLDPTGRHLVVGSGTKGEVFIVPLAGGRPRKLNGFADGAQLWAVAFGAAGRLVAAAPIRDTRAVVIRVWNLETGAIQVLDPGAPTTRETDATGGIMALRFTPGGRLLSAGRNGLVLWNLEDGTHEVIRPGTGEYRRISVSPDGRRVLLRESAGNDPAAEGRVGLHLLDLVEGTATRVSSHGQRVLALGFDSSGTRIVTGDADGVVRVGPVTGEEPHLLFRHEGWVMAVAVSPDDRWIASVASDQTVRLWPMPQGPPFHSLPREHLLGRIRALTNLRVIRDPESPTGYRLTVAPFPGWAAVPSW